MLRQQCHAHIGIRVVVVICRAIGCGVAARGVSLCPSHGCIHRVVRMRSEIIVVMISQHSMQTAVLRINDGARTRGGTQNGADLQKDQQ